MQCIQLAGEMQAMRIRKKKRQTIRPTPGSLFLAKTSGMARVSLRAAVRYMYPRRHSEKRVGKSGFHCFESVLHTICHCNTLYIHVVMFFFSISCTCMVWPPRCAKSAVAVLSLFSFHGSTSLSGRPSVRLVEFSWLMVAGSFQTTKDNWERSNSTSRTQILSRCY